MKRGTHLAAAFAAALLASGMTGALGLQEVRGGPGAAASPGIEAEAVAGLSPRVVERQTGTVKAAGEAAVLPA